MAHEQFSSAMPFQVGRIKNIGIRDDVVSGEACFDCPNLDPSMYTLHMNGTGIVSEKGVLSEFKVTSYSISEKSPNTN